MLEVERKTERLVTIKMGSRVKNLEKTRRGANKALRDKRTKPTKVELYYNDKLLGILVFFSPVLLVDSFVCSLGSLAIYTAARKTTTATNRARRRKWKIEAEGYFTVVTHSERAHSLLPPWRGELFDQLCFTFRKLLGIRINLELSSNYIHIYTYVTPNRRQASERYSFVTNALWKTFERKRELTFQLM